MHDTGERPATETRRTIGHGRDLTDEVTVFVTTVGASSFADCVAHLEAQDVIASFEVIDHVAPLPAALQAMIDRCTTPLFIQVDEDMLLDADAVGRLHQLIRNEWPNVAVVVGLLDDPHLGRAIEGVKVSRHQLVRDFPWRDDMSVLDRNAMLERGGYLIARRPRADSGERLTFGRHVIDPAPAAVFERYRNLEMLRRSRPQELDWFADYPVEFLRRLMSDPNATDFYALMGILAGGRADAADDDRLTPLTLDHRRADHRAQVEAAEALWSALRAGRANDRP